MAHCRAILAQPAPSGRFFVQPQYKFVFTLALRSFGAKNRG